MNQIENLKKDLDEAGKVLREVSDVLSEAEETTDETRAGLRRWNLQKGQQKLTIITDYVLSTFPH